VGRLLGCWRRRSGTGADRSLSTDTSSLLPDRSSPADPIDDAEYVSADAAAGYLFKKSNGEAD
jgi:hypothetical protein